MFFNLTWRNAKRNRNDNLIYFLTMVTAVITFYIVLSLSEQDVIRFLQEIESAAVDRLLSTMIPVVYLCALLFVFFLAFLANRYQLECRSKELGLYLLFGMKKKRLFFQLIVEGLITSILALAIGIVFGIFLSEIISLTTVRLVGQDIIAHQFCFSISAVIFTAIGFFTIQFIALFILGGRLFRKEVYQLLYGEIAKKQRIGNLFGNIFTFLLGVIVLLSAYWIVLRFFWVAGGAMLLLAVILGICGTMLFIRGLSRILSLLARKVKGNTTKGLYIFTLRQLQENIVNKFISVSVSSILMMLTIMLVADGTVTIITNIEQLDRGASVYDFTVTGDNQLAENYLSSETMAPYVDKLNPMETGMMKRPGSETMGSFIDWSIFRSEVVHYLPPDVADPVTIGTTSYEIGADQPAALNILALIDTSGDTPALLPASSYNRLLAAAGEKEVALKNNEVILYLNPDFFGAAQEDVISMTNQIITQSQGSSLLSIDGKSMSLVPYVPMKGLTADENVKIVTALVVPDSLFSSYVNPESYSVYWNFCIPQKLVETSGLLNSIMEVSQFVKTTGLNYESYLNNFGRQLFYVVSSSYTTLYMGLMLLIISCALLALQFLSQVQVTKERYLTLFMLGARHEQIKKSIYQQVFWYFLLPLLLACVSGGVGILAMQTYLHPIMQRNSSFYALLAIIMGIVVLVLTIYAITVALTVNREVEKLKWKPNN